MTPTYREITIRITNAGIEVKVYAWDPTMGSACSRVSGTRFQTWSAVVKLLQRVDLEGYRAVVRVNADTLQGYTVDGKVF